jgi:lipopolysaccharide transport protein LptA
MPLSRSSVIILGLALAARAAAAAPPPTATTASAAPPPAAAARPAPAGAAAGSPDHQRRLISRHAKITVDAMSSELNAKTGRVELIGKVVVSEGNTQVRADRADTTCLAQSASPSTQCANSRWTFQGNVRIEAPPRGSLQSDQAIVEVRNNRIARATIIGNPAVFKQEHASALGMTRGHADQIVYDVSKGTVSLIKDAWLSLSGGSNDITSQQIVYDIRSEKVQATSPGTQGVHITLTPQSLPKQAPKHRSSPGKAAPAAPAPPPPKVASPGGTSPADARPPAAPRRSAAPASSPA